MPLGSAKSVAIVVTSFVAGSNLRIAPLYVSAMAMD